MLIERPKQKIVIRYGRNKAGELVRAYFLLTEIDGRVFAKIIKVESAPPKLKSGKTKNNNRCYLPYFCKNASLPEVIVKEYRPVVSPYVNFDFLTVIKIRAPNQL